MDPSFKKTIVRASVLELSNFAAAQVLRLSSTLILSRLLFPEAFGLSALVSVFLQGLILLSDIGIEQSIIQNKRGDDPKFLNTAWVLHISRGVMLWVASCVLAWPLAKFYGEPELMYLLPVGSLGILISGFNSTSLLSLRRRLDIAVPTLIEIVSQVFGLIVIVIWAYFQRSVWALVAGGLAGGILKLVASHWISVGYRNRFEWDPAAKEEILSFGKWIFGSSALFFLSRQSDRLMMAHFLGVATLGIYSIALNLSEALGTAVTRIIQGVLFPIFSRIHRESPSELSNIYYRMRIRMDAMALIPLGALMVLSQVVIDVLYDDRYRAAGWMLQALCVRAAMSAVLSPMDNCLSSMGHTKYGFLQNISRSVWILAGIPITWHVWGLHGVVWCVAFSEFPGAVMLAIPFRRFGILRWRREALAVGFFCCGGVLGYIANTLLILISNHLGIALHR